ncbi:predicted protein [Sclerotinia sclerotiorum 1980 UF-70]|uniref:Uncharacterized protein n=1 Tax=Sclerotinia sclerotiorum (strain ATCC 18683 / 1980 / Ss-1) TaxID=665079 RepID=A7E494_SCLS1|nr:predicted protein [Sclerotinia sclerotiorum 1980 UF-70]EDN90716.1 predicted protein [Sclerotinia sclerotiorum 1980 UF-70]
MCSAVCSQHPLSFPEKKRRASNKPILITAAYPQELTLPRFRDIHQPSLQSPDSWRIQKRRECQMTRKEEYKITSRVTLILEKDASVSKLSNGSLYSQHLP